MAATVEFLKAEWDALVAQSAANETVAADYFKKVIAAYSEPHRTYHTTKHLQQVIQLLREAAIDDPTVYWASFYHDYVYRPGASDNEALSATLAANQLAHMNVDKNIIERVSSLIIATKNHSISSNDKSGSAFLDADMAILGVSSDEYAEYKNAVRTEFSKTPAFLFNIGRKNFLKNVAAQKRIFITDWFFDKFEERARINIQREIEQ